MAADQTGNGETLLFIVPRVQKQRQAGNEVVVIFSRHYLPVQA